MEDEFGEDGEGGAPVREHMFTPWQEARLLQLKDWWGRNDCLPTLVYGALTLVSVWLMWVQIFAWLR